MAAPVGTKPVDICLLFKGPETCPPLWTTVTVLLEVDSFIAFQTLCLFLQAVCDSGVIRTTGKHQNNERGEFSSYVKQRSLLPHSPVFCFFAFSPLVRPPEPSVRKTGFWGQLLSYQGSSFCSWAWLTEKWDGMTRTDIRTPPAFLRVPLNQLVLSCAFF